MQIVYHHQHLFKSMIRFEDIWARLYEHGACANKEEGTRRFWATLSPEQQERVFTTIILDWFYHEALKRRKYDFLQKFAPLEEHILDF